ncbi:MAG: hypothetical protein K9J06_02530 [Flavobacteriales bacterium]|nr:hypothetical protein [Flavobacteriales bacterium]
MSSPTDNPAMAIEALFEKVEAFGRTTYELSKLKTLETTTVVVTTLIAKMSVVLVLSLFVLVFNIGVALLLGEVLGKLYYGFFIVAGFYLLLGTVLHFLLHRWLKRPISELIIMQALK